MKPLSITVQSRSGTQRISVTPDQRHQRLAEILRHNALPLNTRCGQHGLCDGCLVQLLSGTLRHHATRQSPTAPAAVRACEYTLADEDVAIAIPARSLLAYEPQVVSSFSLNISRSHNPLWRAIALTPADLPATPTLADLATAISVHMGHEPVTIPPAIATAALNLLASSRSATLAIEFTQTGFLATGLLPKAPAAPLGVAIDIGTTTVALLIVDLRTGQTLGSASGFNRQMHLGDDVLTRINLCTTDKRMLARLQSAVVTDTIERLLGRALKEANLTDDHIACLTIAANTTMLHLFAGVDPTPMGFAPFTAPFLDHTILPASAVHLHLTSPSTAPANGPAPASSDPSIHLLPSAAAYVGADITAGIISSGLAYDPGPSLLVDVGTNGEIVFKDNDHFWGAATAAGPAFEGSRMTCGMRAGQGAISHIRITRKTTGVDVAIEVIGDVKPTGICGSAYVDFLAQGVLAGILSPTGRFQPGIADDRIAPYRQAGRCFTIALGHGQEPIVISEGDIASLLQAKAAIAAGILTLLKRIGATPRQIKTLYLAGGFGMHLDVPNTIASGLLPGFHAGQIQLVGNTSLAGAYLALLDSALLQEITRIARSLQIVELNLDPDFESCYIDQLTLPAPAPLVI